MFSTCSRRQYMALIYGARGEQLSSGYNGAPPGIRHCTEGGCPRAQADVAPGSPYGDCIANHAEENAIKFADFSRLSAASLYVNGPPCWQCAKLIAGSGIRRVVYLVDPSYQDWYRCAVILTQANVHLIDVAPETLRTFAAAT